MNNQKSKHLKVRAETGLVLNAIAELLNINRDDLLENIIAGYVASVKNEIEDIANKYPSFSQQYPFIEAPLPNHK